MSTAKLEGVLLRALAHLSAGETDAAYETLRRALGTPTEEQPPEAITGLPHIERPMSEWRTFTLIETGDTNGYRYHDEPCLFSVFRDPKGVFWYVEHTQLDEKHEPARLERGRPVAKGSKPAWVNADGSSVQWRTVTAPETLTLDSPIRKLAHALSARHLSARVDYDSSTTTLYEGRVWDNYGERGVKGQGGGSGPDAPMEALLEALAAARGTTLT